MKVPIGWLREFVDAPLVAEDLVRRLTFSGIEVESVTHLGAGLDGVVVGEITAISPHPNADRLVVCQVHDGQQVVPVVCGARNMQPGDKAAFMPAGGVLPGGLRIEARAVRGVASHGMLCAEDELGLSEDHAGILIVDRALPAGTPLAAALGLPETILDLEITWNRSDCLSIIGIAREVAALYGVPLRLPSPTLAEEGPAVETLAHAAIAAPEACARYTARAIRGVTWGPSPAWMQRRLTQCGIRPIANVVDVTNYVMLECGQPLHAFDHDRLRGAEIQVRMARTGETMRTLDGVARELSAEMLVIADAERPVAVAGVMGGEGSEIDAGTRNVLLESASFDARRVHRTSVALGLSSESSHRFERGVDPELAAWASARAAALLAEVAGGRPAPGLLDVYPGRPAPRTIVCRFDRVRALLGVAVPNDTITAIFDRLGLGVAGVSAAQCEVCPPSFRADLEIEADLIEEVARLHGLEQVPEVLPRAAAGINVDDRRSWALQRLRERLIGLGLREALHYSFTSHKVLDAALGGEDGAAAERAVLPNPVSADYAVLRPSLWPVLIQTLGYNVSRQSPDAALFELGRVFTRGPGGVVVEGERLAIGLVGRVGRIGLDGRRPVEPAEMLAWLKGIIDAVLRAQCGAAADYAPEPHPALDPDWAMRLTLGGVPLGRAGLLRADLRETWRMAGPAALAEIDLAPLLDAPARAPRFEPIPVYPAIRHDVALIVRDETRHEQVVAAIRAAGPPELTDIVLFDIFKGKATGDGRKSMAYALTYRSPERTLTDEEANGYDERIRAGLRRDLGAEIREG